MFFFCFSLSLFFLAQSDVRGSLYEKEVVKVRLLLTSHHGRLHLHQQLLYNFYLWQACHVANISYLKALREDQTYRSPESLCLVGRKKEKGRVKKGP